MFYKISVFFIHNFFFYTVPFLEEYNYTDNEWIVVCSEVVPSGYSVSSNRVVNPDY